MDARLSRRALLATLGGLAPLAGCGDFGGQTERQTATPAPVPTRATPSSVADAVVPVACPELPSNAEVYVCSPTRADDADLRLVPARGAYRTDAGEITLSLVNETVFTFRTGRDWWTLARRVDGDWAITAQGNGSGRLLLGPGEDAAWRVGGDSPRGDVTHLDVDLTGDYYALAITGYVSAGELTAVIAPFSAGGV